MKYILIICAFFATSFLEAQTTYYVSPTGSDLAAGTLFAPFQTINHALGVSAPGTTVFLMGGTYSEVVFMPSGAIGNRITLTNYSTQTATLTSPIGNTDAIINIIDASYVTIQGLIISGYYANDARGILIEGACNDVWILDNRIDNISFTYNSLDPVLPNSNAQPLIVLGTDSIIPVSNLLIKDNTILTCLTGHSEGLALNGNVNGFEISNNNVIDISNIGIDVIGGEGTCPSLLNDNARNGVIRWNQVVNCYSVNQTCAGIYSDGANNVTIENNVVFECGWGIEAGCENIGVVSSNIIIRNNVVFHNREGGIVIGGYDYPTGSGKVVNSLVQHNTIVGNNLNAANGEIIVNYTENCAVNGNIAYNASDPLLFTNDAGSINLLCDYNCFFAGGAADFSLNGITYSGLSAWQLANGTDQNSMETDPMLVNVPGLNLHLSALSPCIDSGDIAFVPAPSEADMDTSTRVQNGRVDIGADEYGTAVGIYIIQAVSNPLTWSTDYLNGVLVLSWLNPLNYEERILLTDVQGKLISRTEMCIGEQGVAISFQGLAAGTYYAILTGTSVAVPIVVPE